jgi:F0F1-type ATP synthase delta subunit
MKYAPAIYAKALADVIDRTGAKEEAAVSRNLLALLERNGDRHALSRILAETERLLRKKNGERRIVIESARPLAPDDMKKLLKLAKPDDTIETAIVPELIAGVRITVDDEDQFDGTLKTKLRTLFPDA